MITSAAPRTKRLEGRAQDQAFGPQRWPTSIVIGFRSERQGLAGVFARTWDPSNDRVTTRGCKQRQGTHEVAPSTNHRPY